MSCLTTLTKHSLHWGFLSAVCWAPDLGPPRSVTWAVAPPHFTCDAAGTQFGDRPGDHPALPPPGSCATCRLLLLVTCKHAFYRKDANCSFFPNFMFLIVNWGDF